MSEWNGWDVATVLLIDEQRQLVRWLADHAVGDELARARAMERHRRLVRALEVAFEAYAETYPLASTDERIVEAAS